MGANIIYALVLYRISRRYLSIVIVLAAAALCLVIIVLLYFPTLIAAGAGATLSPGLKKLCAFLGNLSYPLYMTHYGVMWIFGSYLASHKPDTLILSLMIVTGVVLLSVFAYVVQRLYDEPLRRYLANPR